MSRRATRRRSPGASAGAIVIGKTSTHEFAWGITSQRAALDSGRNPWSTDRVSGGSSGGSAVVLAAGEVPLALGTDTGGSIRVPAPSVGSSGSSRPTGGSALRAWPAGAIARPCRAIATTPADAALFLEAIAGRRRRPVDRVIPVRDLETPRARHRRLVVGLCPDLNLVPLAPDVRDVFDSVGAARAVGARLVEVPLPEAELILPAFRTIQSAEALDTHRRAGLFPARRDEYGADVLGRLDAAGDVTVEQYLHARADRERVRAAFARLFGSCDVLLTPVSAARRCRSARRRSSTRAWSCRSATS